MWYVIQDCRGNQCLESWLLECGANLTTSYSDIPAHTYQATFEPNKEWSSFYATSPEIHRYWKRIVDKYGCMKYIKLRQQVEAATWDENTSKWNVQVSQVRHWATEL